MDEIFRDVVLLRNKKTTLVPGRTTPETFVRQTHIPTEVDRPHRVREVTLQFDVSTPLTPTTDHLYCLDLGRCSEEVIQLIN